MEFDLSFYKDKRVLVTGHTGFKGSWLCHFLYMMGAKVIGYSLAPKTIPSLFELANISKEVTSIIGDIRDIKLLQETFNRYRPDIVFHLAAQPIVRESYNDPVGTYSTNVMGTVNLFDCIRHCDSVQSVVNITTDKVYQNNEWPWGYREVEPLNGYDPYSNSKSCSELVTNSYKLSFFKNRNIAISTARAGNVIGGGDFASDRIIPDCIRAAIKNKDIIVRNPYSTRPYQHVIEPIYAYLMIAARQFDDMNLASSYNVGPNETDSYKTGDLVDVFVDYWGNGIRWVNRYDGGPHEANYLKLDCSKLKTVFGWKPRWSLTHAIKMTITWVRAWQTGESINDIMTQQINEYIKS